MLFQNLILMGVYEVTFFDLKPQSKPLRIFGPDKSDVEGYAKKSRQIFFYIVF